MRVCVCINFVTSTITTTHSRFISSVSATRYSSILLPSIFHSCRNHSLILFYHVHILILSLSLSLSTFVSRARSFRSSFFSLCTDCELRINDKLRPNLRYDSVFFFFFLYRVFLFKGKSENLKALSFLVSRLCIYIYVRLVSCTTIVQEFILIEITWIISNMIYI